MVKAWKLSQNSQESGINQPLLSIEEFCDLTGCRYYEFPAIKHMQVQGANNASFILPEYQKDKNGNQNEAGNQPSAAEWLEKLAIVQNKHNYPYRDELIIDREHLPDFDAKLKIFFEEHLHEDDEIRLAIDGSGYFDCRNRLNDEWLRVEMVAGDLLILPAGIYHRFCLDDRSQFIHVIRLFQQDPKWTPINRPLGNDNPCRKEYCKKYQVESGPTSAFESDRLPHEE